MTASSSRGEHRRPVTRLTAGYRSARPACESSTCISSSSPAMACGGTRSYEFARRFVERGHEVRMVTAGGAAAGRWTGIEVVGVRGAYSDYMRATGDVLPAPHARVRALRARRDAGRAARAAARRGLRHLAAAHDGAAGARWPPLRWRAPLVFEVRDLWPEAPIQMGALRNPLRAAARAGARALRLRAQRAADRAVARHPRRRAAPAPAEERSSCRTPPTSSCSTPAPAPRDAASRSCSYFGAHGRGQRPDRGGRGRAARCRT